MRLLLLITLMLGITSCGFLFQPVDTIIKGKDMAYETTGEIMTGKNAIHNYEWFKQQEADIRRLGKQYSAAERQYKEMKAELGPRKDWDYNDKQDMSMLRTNMTGLSQMLDKAIEDYNAKSSMASRNVFKDNLPSNIQRGMYVAKEMITQ